MSEHLHCPRTGRSYVLARRRGPPAWVLRGGRRSPWEPVRSPAGQRARGSGVAPYGCEMRVPDAALGSPCSDLLMRPGPARPPGSALPPAGLVLLTCLLQRAAREGRSSVRLPGRVLQGCRPSAFMSHLRAAVSFPLRELPRGPECLIDGSLWMSLRTLWELTRFLLSDSLFHWPSVLTCLFTLNLSVYLFGQCSV